MKLTLGVESLDDKIIKPAKESLRLAVEAEGLKLDSIEVTPYNHNGRTIYKLVGRSA